MKIVLRKHFYGDTCLYFCHSKRYSMKLACTKGNCEAQSTTLMGGKYDFTEFNKLAT